MSSSLFARNERHRFVVLLLRIRLVAYLVVGVPLLLASQPSVVATIAGFVVIAVAAGLPFVARETGAWSGVRVAAGLDLLVSYAVWLLLPEIAPFTIVLSMSAVAVMVFLAPERPAQRFGLFAVALEASKILVVWLAPEVLDRSVDAVAWTIIARSAVLSGTYFLVRALDEYFTRLYFAAESGSDHYRRLMDAAPTALLVVSEGTITYANDEARTLAGGPGLNLEGSPFLPLLAEPHRRAFTEGTRRVLDRLEAVSFEDLKLTSMSGEERIVDLTVSAVDIGEGLSIQVAINDVSAQRKAETELQETRLNYRSFFERIPVALYRTRSNGDIIQANRGLVELLGAQSESELVGLRATDFYADADDRRHLVSMLEDERIVVGYESKMRRLDGETIWVRDTARVIETDIGLVYEGAMVDVTARRNIEDELWARAMQQEAAASIGQMALEAEDINSVMRSVTETVARVLRTDGAAVLQRGPAGTFTLVGQSHDLDLEASTIADIADRAHMTAAPVVLRSDAEVAFSSPKLGERGVQSAVAVMVPGQMNFGTLVVISERQRVFTSDDLNFLHAVANVLAAAADRAMANARLEELLRSKDSFVASVSHELRTPLTVVTGMAHELRERWQELSPKDMDEFTEMLVDQSGDMADLIEDLLVAARSNIGNVAVRNEPVDLDDQVASVLAGFQAQGDVDIKATLEPAIVDADPIRVRQIIRNLITNAIRYGGPNIEVVMSSTAGARVVEVIDDGPGIGESDRERIFEPYERAHDAVGQPGSVGLGLSVSRTLAELMGGSLTYRFDRRSIFTLELSRAAERETQRSQSVPSDSQPAPVTSVGLGRMGVDVGVVDEVFKASS
ncbi:MAG: PAS domain S-box protein [Acidimicrobiia bacterium]